MADQAENESIFNKESGSTDDNQESQATGDFTVPEELRDWVGEGRKWHSLDDALKSIPHAQTHIQQLETELRELREQQASTEEIKAAIEELKSAKQETGERPSDSSFGPDDVSKLVESAIERRERERVQQSNIQKVVASMTEKFGDSEKAEAEYVKAGEASGLSVADLNALAAKSPQAVLRLVGISESKAPTGSARETSSFRTEALGSNPNRTERRTVMGSGSIKNDLAQWERIKNEINQKIGG